MKKRTTAWFVYHEEWATYPDGKKIGWDFRDYVGTPESAVVFLTNNLGADDDEIRRIRAEIETERFAEYGSYWITAHDLVESDARIYGLI